MVVQEPPIIDIDPFRYSLTYKTLSLSLIHV